MANAWVEREWHHLGETRVYRHPVYYGDSPYPAPDSGDSILRTLSADSSDRRPLDDPPQI